MMRAKDRPTETAFALIWFGGGSNVIPFFGINNTPINRYKSEHNWSVISANTKKPKKQLPQTPNSKWTKSWVIFFFFLKNSKWSFNICDQNQPKNCSDLETNSSWKLVHRFGAHFVWYAKIKKKIYGVFFFSVLWSVYFFLFKNSCWIAHLKVHSKAHIIRKSKRKRKKLHFRKLFAENMENRWKLNWNKQTNKSIANTTLIGLFIVHI